MLEISNRELAELSTKWPAVFAYVNRVGAMSRNFRNHVVREMDEDSKYWRDLVRIKIGKDGGIEVQVTPKDREEIDPAPYQPTDQEREQIKSEVKGSPFPESLPASKDDLPDDLIGVDPKEYFPYPAERGELVLWIQWRRQDEFLRPYYLPFTKWSDNRWRMMEPDGLLPLYGLDRIKGRDSK
jgi:hypothetical protein